MKKKKNKSINKNNKKENNIKSIVLIVLSIIMVIIVFILSTKLGPKGNKIINNFNISDFENVSAIGLGEYKASFAYDGVSIIFFCSNEEEKCYDELKDLNLVAKENKLTIEYLNILELVEDEKNELDNLLDKKGKALFPTLLIINNNEIKENIDTYISENEIVELFKKQGLIK